MAGERQPYEVPPEVRDMAVRAIADARQAVERMMEAARRTADSTSAQAASLQAEANDANARVVGYAHDQVKAALDLAEKLARATSISEVAQLQMEFARHQAEALSSQMQDFGEFGRRFMSSFTAAFKGKEPGP